MAHRTISTERQHVALFNLPTDEIRLLRYGTLAEDDLGYMQTRCRVYNRFGFALQLCASRFPADCLLNSSVELKRTGQYYA